MLFKWKDAYSCNVEAIDQQHKKLFELGSKLYSIVSLKDGADHYDEIMDVLVELKDYTIYHFDYEEALLEKHGFQGLQDHLKEHNSFIDKIVELENEDIDEKQSKITMDIIIFISNWIEQHILKSDMQYKAFLNDKGVH
ncbi:bacteriohemerythrin [Geosporobacter ferrireducens]|uniref:Bacteriohemerythrin n=1 Tax=Geosporobacter ferrireducens TaxID=1424294 RepID=A0A1D8GPQ3_9FIRM|nr:bacteriohemerythrin [Geosporobacter ferrireducens]AOT72902.1 bacteriohemerythrin [Geosporobacter ferrireducens]MTI55308.1 bacteriohemerythrin [Geosporobacter ferrireducens]